MANNKKLGVTGGILGGLAAAGGAAAIIATAGLATPAVAAGEAGAAAGLGAAEAGTAAATGAEATGATVAGETAKHAALKETMGTIGNKIAEKTGLSSVKDLSGVIKASATANPENLTHGMEAVKQGKDMVIGAGIDGAVAGMKAEESMDANNQNGYSPIATQQNTQTAQPIATFNQQNTMSDERLKEVLRTEDPVDCFSKINSYVYKYTPEAQQMYGDEANGGSVNGDENFGVMAQELADNPITQSAVNKDENGYLMLNNGRLSSINTAMIAELCKRIEDLENAIYGRK